MYQNYVYLLIRVTHLLRVRKIYIISILYMILLNTCMTKNKIKFWNDSQHVLLLGDKDINC